MAAVADHGGETHAGERRTLYWRFSRFLERHLPAGLYQRSLIIVIAPMVALQLVMTVMFMERHWENVTKTLSKSVAREMAFIVAMYEASPKTPESLKQLEAYANENLAIGMEIQENATLPPPVRRPLFSLLDLKLNKYINRNVAKPFWIDTVGSSDFIDTRIEVDKGLIFRFLTKEERAYASSTDIFLLAMVGSSIVLLIIAVIFLRNQIRPILQLAETVESFEKGRSVADFHPRGAAEVRQAAAAFVHMKERIEHHAKQRTVMLAGISHDLRTILTRFKLELALLGESSRVKALKEDVAEMQRMLEGYMAFVRGDGGELPEMTDIGGLLNAVKDSEARSGRQVSVEAESGLRAPVKPQALKRCIGNLVANATRFAKTVTLSAERNATVLLIAVDDDGPGIPAAEREAVFRPFVRLDNARNQDAGGTGLGLAIARDIALSHGGDIRLDDSRLGGLRVEVSLPL